MKEMQYLLLPYDPATCLRLNLTSYQLEKESRMIRRFIHKKSHFIDVAIESSWVTVSELFFFILAVEFNNGMFLFDFL